MTLTPRLFALVAVLVVVQAVYTVIQLGALFNVRPPATDVNELPLKLGDWVCSEPSCRDSDAEDIAGADICVQRVYSNANEQATISVYVAIWTSYQGYFRIPHEPLRCYASAGHEIHDVSRIVLKRSDGSTAQTALLQTDLADRPTHVLYWYQLDQSAVLNAQEMFRTRLRYRSQKSWPPLVKVMLETSGADQQSARQLLVDLGERIFDWTSKEL